jgi:hypothetical protein
MPGALLAVSVGLAAGEGVVVAPHPPRRAAIKVAATAIVKLL